MTLPLAMLVAALAGFLSLSYEILWYRAYSFVSEGSPAAFGLLLGAFLFGIAAGSMAAWLLCRGSGGTGDPRRLTAIAVFTLAANLLSFAAVPLLAHICVAANWRWSLPVVAIAAGLMGATLPLVSHFGIAPDDRAGARLSYVYGSNIVGSTCGSLVTGSVLLDRLSMARTASVLAVLGVLLSAGVLAFARPTAARMAAAALGGLALCAAVIAFTPRLHAQLYERLFDKQEYRADHPFQELIENRHGVITVRDGKVYGGGAYDGAFNTSLQDDRNSIYRAYLLGALRPRAGRVLMIGLASGSWAQVIANMPGLEKMTVVEINPGYLELIRSHAEVRTLLDHPRVEVVIDDGRRWLSRHRGEPFDLVVMNATWHYRAHVTNLLSREFLGMIRGSLAPGGLLYFNTTGSEAAMRTALSVFGHGMRAFNFIAASDAPVQPDREQWRGILSRWSIDGRPVLGSDPDARLQALLPLVETFSGPPVALGLEGDESLRRRLGNGPVITDDNMHSEWYPLEPPP
jgi:spermidine synthase